jgi:hypothetical protein
MPPNDEPPRAEDPTQKPPRLPDAAVVVRGGLSAPRTLHRTALEHFDKHGLFAISAASLPDMSADELAAVAQLPHPRIRETTVGAIRRAGHDVVPDEPPPAHALITLPRLPTDDDYMTIADLFGPPRPNPVTVEGGTDA